MCFGPVHLNVEEYWKLVDKIRVADRFFEGLRNKQRIVLLPPVAPMRVHQSPAKAGLTLWGERGRDVNKTLNIYILM